MPTPGKVVLRRTWPQRIVMVMCLAVIGSALAAAWFTDDFYRSVASIGRVEIPGEVLRTETAPGEPVNFLLIGNDSALRLDPSDPVNIGRLYDPRGTFNADSITMLRVDPGSGQAWILSIPRDLRVPIPGSGTWRINAALLIGGPPLLVETITENFDLEINHYVELDFLAFQEVIDRLNGVPVWFDHPARDEGTGLNVPVAGCRVLDGREALAYVRARQYQEFIDGEWVRDGRADLGRIERQQDFLVLALDRAIERGARNPTTLASLIEAGAESVILDTELTPAELIDLGEAFSEFNPDNLRRLGLSVTPVYDDAGRYQGEEMVAGANEAAFAVFRGVEDLVPPSEVRFDLYAADEVTLEGDGGILTDTIGFAIVNRRIMESIPDQTVIIHPPGQRADAEALARWLLPIPAVVEDPDAARMALVLGADHEQVLFLFPHDVASTRAGIEAHGDVTVPDLSAVVTTATEATVTTTTVAVSTSTTAAPAPASTDAPTTTAPDDTDGDTAGRIIGRPPDGENCG